MTNSSALAAQILPVSILTGPSTGELLKDIVASDSNCRFGLLTSAANRSDVGSGTGELLVEKLAGADHHGGYDPAKISAQIEALAEKALIDHLIIECDSHTHPIAFASLFLPRDGDGQGLSHSARLSSIVQAIQSGAVVDSIVYGRPITDLPSPCILADQLEVANLVVLNNDTRATDFGLARAVVSAINPSARIIPISSAVASEKLLDATSSFDFAAASEGAGWRKVVEAESDAPADGHNVSTFAYRAQRPFHPEKLWNLLQRRFPGVFRAKGYFWLATRMEVVGGLNIAGSECHYAPAGEWWAAVAQKDDAGHIEVPDRLRKVWTEPFGDRRQAIAFMGIDMNSTELSGQLDACLLDDSEMAEGETGWAMLPDPFPTWSGHSHDHECDDHDCGHHH
jgi:G3E family GTPase